MIFVSLYSQRMIFHSPLRLRIELFMNESFSVNARQCPASWELRQDPSWIPWPILLQAAWPPNPSFRIHYRRNAADCEGNQFQFRPIPTSLMDCFTKPSYFWNELFQWLPILMNGFLCYRHFCYQFFLSRLQAPRWVNQTLLLAPLQG
jgi:hypothetical protein